jgi:hypothetical protein
LWGQVLFVRVVWRCARHICWGDADDDDDGDDDASQGEPEPESLPTRGYVPACLLLIDLEESSVREPDVPIFAAVEFD